MKIFQSTNVPLILPIVFFILVILVGAVLLHVSEEKQTDSLSWTDSVFTATSAACVTGLVVVDTGSYFTFWGQVVILCLMQLGGLGIMTFTSLSIYLLRHRTTIADRIAVGQVLLHDPRFNLGRFLVDIVRWTFLIEFTGAAILYFLDPKAFSPFSAVFHSVSAFCNAGFSLFPSSLTQWAGAWGINLVFMVLIVVGGMGFSVFLEFKNSIIRFLRRQKIQPGQGVSWYSKVVLRTCLFLIILGWFSIYLAEYVAYDRALPTSDALLVSLFQSITCRTAGFNTIDIGQMTNLSLVMMLFLMFIGGAPGSCAGGLKVTTFRVITATIWSQLKGRSQVAIGKFAINETAVKRAMVLFVLASAILFLATFILDFTEGGDTPHVLVRGQFLEILFESVSAFCTVGLSTGITSTLSVTGKWVMILLMFTGRLGPFLLINALQRMQKVQFYRLPEENMMIG